MDTERALPTGDEDIVRAARLGSRVAFEELVHRHGRALYGYVRRLVHDDGAAEEVVQDAFVAAWRGIGDFRYGSSFRTWLFALASHKAIDWRRRRVPVPVDESVADESGRLLAPERWGPAARAVDREFVAALERELSALPYHQRACWWLREVEGLSHAEIAHVLLIGRGSVRGNLQRARAHLAVAMRPWRGGAPGHDHRPGHPGDLGDDREGGVG